MENIAEVLEFPLTVIEGKKDTNDILVDDLDSQEIYNEEYKKVLTKVKNSCNNISYIDEFHDDYLSYIGSMITPSGKLRSTPASKKDAWRYAIDEYRKRKREMNSLSDMENISDDCNTFNNSVNSPEASASLDILVNRIFDTLEVKDRDYEICRYLSAVLFNLDIIHTLKGKTKVRIVKYLRTVNIKELGSTDKQMGIALNYEISSGSQCRKLVSIKKRLIDRMASIGVTRLDLGR